MPPLSEGDGLGVSEALGLGAGVSLTAGWVSLGAGEGDAPGGRGEKRTQTSRRESRGGKPRLKQAGLRGEHNESHAKRKAGWAKPKPKKNARKK